MGLSLGYKNTSGKTTSTGTFDRSTMPVLPDWLQPLVQGGVEKSFDLANTNPNVYVAPADPLQSQAAVGVGGLTGSPWNFDAAADLTRSASDYSYLDDILGARTPSVQAPDMQKLIQQFADPYTKDVLDSALADFDAAQGTSTAEQDLKLGGDGAFGGSGAALAKALSAGEYARGRGGLTAGIKDQAYRLAAQLAGDEANRRLGAQQFNADTYERDAGQKAAIFGGAQQGKLAAGGQLAGLATGMDANTRANTAAQAGIGGMMRDIASEFAKAPLEVQSWLSQTMPPWLQALVGEHSTGTETQTGKSKSSGFSFGVSTGHGGGS